MRSTLLASALFAGCAGTTDSAGGGGTAVTASYAAGMTQTGFLSDYKRLQTAPWGDGIQCWRDAGLVAGKYDKVLIARIVVTLKDGQSKGIDPTDLKVLTDYFYASLVKALKPQLDVVEKSGEGVVVIRLALTNLIPTNTIESLGATAVPYGFVAEAGAGAASGRPAGSTPYLGETGIEMQFLDGGSNAILAECRDDQIGRKYAADLNSGAAGAAGTWARGYANSFQSWSYARNAFDKWSALTAMRVAELRGTKSPSK